VSDHGPDFDELVDPGDPDRARLEAAHDLLVAAGPLPQLPRRRYTAIAAVAIAATVLFGVGYAIGGRDSPEKPVETVAMAGPSGATASIELLALDEAGNWPMTIAVKGLPQLPQGQTYALWLTRNGKLADPCGTFAVGPGSTVVPLNAPYKLKNYDGWVVVRTGTTKPFLLRTTKV
jgi:Anti-sigma-K factor rskA, C-terminal